MKTSATKHIVVCVAVTAISYAVLLTGTASAQKILSPLLVTTWATYWVIGAPAMDLSPMCAPAVRFTIQNKTDHDLDGIEVSASFRDDAAKNIFGGSVDFWSDATGQPALPPGYTRETELLSPHGFKYYPGSCAPDRLPELTVKVQAKLVGEFDVPPIFVGESSVDKTKSVWFDPATRKGARP